jgi:transposase
VFLALRIGIDIACRASHRAACADSTGQLLWRNVRFQTRIADLEALWKRIPEGEDDITVVMEPTRNAWVPLAAWFRRHGAQVVMVPPEQSADLRAYYNKHTKTDRLDAELLARLPALHPEGLHLERGLGVAEPLRRSVKIRSNMVKRRTRCLQRLDALLEIYGPEWALAIGSVMCSTVLAFLTRWGDPQQVLRLGQSRLTRWLIRQSHGLWREHKAQSILAGAKATVELWGPEGMDFAALAADIATEAELALDLDRQIKAIDQRIAAHYDQVDPRRIVLSAPGVGKVLAAQIAGRLGDVSRFTNLAAVRCYTGLVPRQNSSGVASSAGGPTKRGDTCLREAIFLAADHARRCDPSLAARYYRLMVESGKHHTSAVCSIAAVLITRIATCLRSGEPYRLRDVDGTPICVAEGRRIVKERYVVPESVRQQRRTVRRPIDDKTSSQKARKGRGSGTKSGVAKRSKVSAAPQPACTS